MHPEQEILERIKQARQPQDSEEQPQEAEPTAELEQEPTEEIVEEAESNTDADVTEPEVEEETALETEETEELYLDLDGREIPLSDIREWEQGNLRQQDYTRKTQALADERKAIEQSQADLIQKSEVLETRIAELDAVFDSASKEVNWDELREYDPSEYLKQKELQEARKTALDKAKSERDSLRQEQTQGQMQAELQRLADLNPHWIDGGKQTEAYESDMSMVRDYLNDLGLTEAQQQGILLTGHGQAYIDAAKFHKGQKKNVAVAKKVKKTPVVTKPGGARVNPKIEALEKAKKAHAKHGTVETAMALRKAQSNAA